MRGMPIQSRIVEALGDRALTAPAVATELEIDTELAQRELETMFAGSKVECAQREDGVFYRLPKGHPPWTATLSTRRAGVRSRSM